MPHQLFQRFDSICTDECEIVAKDEAAHSIWPTGFHKSSLVKDEIDFLSFLLSTRYVCETITAPKTAIFEKCDLNI